MMRGALATMLAGALASVGMGPAPAFAAPLEPAVAAQSCTLSAREVATRFMNTLYLDGDVRGAFETWVDPDYIQHNPHAKTGRQAAIDFLEAAWKANPRRQSIIHRVIASDGLVAFHIETRNSPEERGAAVVDILRVKGCKVVEHWDVIQPIPESTPNGNGMFRSIEIKTEGKTSEPCTLSTRQVADGFVPLLYGQGKVREAYETWVHPDYVQHNPHAQSGRDAAIAFLEPFYARNPTHRMIVYRVITDGDLIAVHLQGKTKPEDRGAAAVDILRVDNCKIVEHWDVTQSVPEASVNDNGMF